MHPKRYATGYQATTPRIQQYIYTFFNQLIFKAIHIILQKPTSIVLIFSPILSSYQMPTRITVCLSIEIVQYALLICVAWNKN